MFLCVNSLGVWWRVYVCGSVHRVRPRGADRENFQNRWETGPSVQSLIAISWNQSDPCLLLPSQADTLSYWPVTNSLSILIAYLSETKLIHVWEKSILYLHHTLRQVPQFCLVYLYCTFRGGTANVPGLKHQRLASQSENGNTDNSDLRRSRQNLHLISLRTRLYYFLRVLIVRHLLHYFLNLWP